MLAVVGGGANGASELLDRVASAGEVEVEPRGMEVSAFQQKKASMKIPHDPS